MENNELYHWGIKGMKWGVRRYQNTDGSLTDLGKKRYYTEADKGGYKEQSVSGARYKHNKNGKVERFDADKATIDEWVKRDLQENKNVAESGRELTNNLRQLNRSTTPKPNRTRMDLSNMSDKEMRDKIQRELIERQYNDLFNPTRVNKGRERVDKTLEVAGSVLGVAASSLAIALSIKKLKDG